MNHQTKIKEPKMPPIHDRPCVWCGEPSVREAMIEKPRNSQGVEIKPARMVPVCDEHAKVVARNEEVATLRRKRRLVRSRIDHPKYADKQPSVRAELVRLEKRLLALGERLDDPFTEAA